MALLNRYKTYLVSAFFVLFFLLGLLIYKNYGISWDEPLQRDLGTATYNYVLHADISLFKLNNLYHGSPYQLLLTFIEYSLRLTDLKQIYLMRHLVNFLFFFLSCIFFYLLGKGLFNSWKKGLLGTFLLIISPRIFSDAFFNPKDLIYLELFIIAAFFTYRFLKKENFIDAMIMGLLGGLLTSIRVMGVLFPALVLLTYLAKFKRPKVSEIIMLLVFLATLALTTYCTWPVLWEHPMKTFQAAWVSNANYPQDTDTLYFGTLVTSLKLPWHYVMGWIAVTTPISYLFLFLSGLILMIISIKKIDRFYLFVTGWLFIPIIAVIYYKSSLYDGYRHLYFIYPAMLIFSLYGLFQLLKVKIRFIRYLILALLIFDLSQTAFFMIKYHPFQNVYFNLLAGDRNTISNRFALDYWGLSFKQSLTFLDKNIFKPKIILRVADYPGQTNIIMQDHPERFVLVRDMDQADYYVTSFRNENRTPLAQYHKIYSIKVEGYEINSVYQLR